MAHGMYVLTDAAHRAPVTSDAPGDIFTWVLKTSQGRGTGGGTQGYSANIYKKRVKKAPNVYKLAASASSASSASLHLRHFKRWRPRL